MQLQLKVNFSAGIDKTQCCCVGSKSFCDVIDTASVCVCIHCCCADSRSSCDVADTASVYVSTHRCCVDLKSSCDVVDTAVVRMCYLMAQSSDVVHTFMQGACIASTSEWRYSALTFWTGDFAGTLHECMHVDRLTEPPYASAQHRSCEIRLLQFCLKGSR